MALNKPSLLTGVLQFCHCSYTIQSLHNGTLGSQLEEHAISDAATLTATVSVNEMKWRLARLQPLGLLGESLLLYRDGWVEGWLILGPN